MTISISINIGIITFALTIYHCLTLPPLKMHDFGDNPKSVVLTNDNIFTITSFGVLLSNPDGSFISLSEHQNTSSIVELAKYPNGQVASFNGAVIYLYTNQGVYNTQVSYGIGIRPNIMDYTSIINHNNNDFLIATTNNNQLILYLIDSNTFAMLRNAIVNIQSTQNVECVQNARGNLFYCALIQESFPEVLEVFGLDTTLSITSQIAVQTPKGRYLKLKHIGGGLYSMCYLTYEANAYCCLFNEATGTISNPSLIVSATDNFTKNAIDIGVLSKQELLFVYVDNIGMRISAIKMSYTGTVIGSTYTFSLSSNGYISQLSYVAFSNGRKGVVYGCSGQAVYFQEVDIPTCLDYCNSVGFSVTTMLDLALYSSSSLIRFTAFPQFGQLQTFGIQLSLDTDYSIASIEYVSSSVPSIGSAKFKAVNSNEMSSECSINIIVGDKVICPCSDPLYTFQNQCISNCPSYTYTDITNRQCINCASLHQYLYLGNCKNKADLPDSVYVTNTNYNVVEDCQAPCKTCIDSASNCLSCIPGQICSLLCSPGFIYSIAKGICAPCYDSCATCSNEGDATAHNCLSCKPGYETIPTFPNQCFISCRDPITSRWFINANRQYTCINAPICPSIRPIYISDTNQCVESCSKTSTCIKCQLTIGLLFSYQNSCIANCPSGYIKNEQTSQCDKMADIDIDITDKPVDKELGDIANNSTLIPGKNIVIIIGDNYTVEIYNSTDKGGNLALSQIDFSKCERILRKEYSIAEGDILIFVKIDINRKLELTNQVEYEVYDSKRTKLDLKHCDDTTIDVTYYIKNSSVIDVETGKYYEELGIDIYNPNDPFFVDICFPFTTANGTDIILRDRLKDIYKNISLCEQSCSYKGIDLQNMTVTCTCSIKQEVNTVESPNFFAQGVTDVFTNSNFMVVTCYNLVLNTDILISNVGFWVYLIFIALHLPNWIYYFVMGVGPIRTFVLNGGCMPNKPKPNPNKTIKKANDYITTIIEETEQGNNEMIKFRESRRNSQASIMNINPNAMGNITNSSNTPNSSKGFSGELKTYSPNRQRRQSLFMNEESPVNEKLNPPLERKRNLNDNQIIVKDFTSDTISSHNIILKNDGEVKEKFSLSPFLQGKQFDGNASVKVYQSNNHTLNKQDSSQYEKTQMTKADDNKTTITQMSMNTELALHTISSDLKLNGNNSANKKKPSMETLDDFEYKEAIVYDNRSFFRQLYICLKNKHSILVTFVKECTLELRNILMIVYLFENSMDFAFNAFFFTDDLISKRYHYEGYLSILFTLQTNFIASLASFGVSLLLGFLLNLLTTSRGKLEDILANNTNKKDQLLIKSLKCLKVKLAFYLLFELLLVLFFWYYVTAFCSVYQSSQWSWFTGGCMSFGIGLLVPIVISLGIISLRYLALIHKKECLFRFAQWCFRI